jgi:hypothetical protein
VFKQFYCERRRVGPRARNSDDRDVRFLSVCVLKN